MVSPPGFAEIAETKGFVRASGDQATGQVDGPAQTEPPGNFSEPLAAGGQEPAQKPAFAQFLQPRLPATKRCQEPFAATARRVLRTKGS